ncbi:RNA polymerase [Streptomyces sp. RerS4]|uniref:RNA polymerase n=1 Tax=Streptomyces sp. RerS4 TaxID=2942449 RepID=UPI00201C1F58|nr:RNA polymerase [Streptomyces sp. RerS4]UQX02698.1 RNA polymerase [Streptomyces sp. RerS4]
MGAVDRRSGRDPEFEAFVAGAAGRLLYVAILLTAEPADEAPVARRLLAGALARTYAHWARLRGDDPYDRTRQELCTAYARGAWRLPGGTGVLAPLSPLERLVVVLRIHEGVAEEVTAAQLGLPPERVEAIRNRAVAILRGLRAAGAAPAPDTRRGAA